MKDEFYYGRIKYVSFILLDILCLVASNYVSYNIYISRFKSNYTFKQYVSVVGYMLVVDLFITCVFNTLQRVLRRRKQKELKEGVKHVVNSFITLSVVLFLFKLSSDYSRVIITLSYSIYFVLFFGSHIIWSQILQKMSPKKKRKTVLLMTADGFVEEGIERLKQQGFEIRYIHLLKNRGMDSTDGIPVIKTWERTAAAICWDMLDKVYIYGLDHQMIVSYLRSACKDMGIMFDLIDFTYREIDIKTIRNEDQNAGALTFLEGKRDIPFPIRRVYWITNAEAEKHRGFHAHKMNCQLLFCPYGVIDIILDDGDKRTTVTLDDPGKGLILMPGLWREMVWKKSRSVLCVLASEYYDPEEYIRDYAEFLDYTQKYKNKFSVQSE